MVMDRLTKRIDGGLVFPNELIGVMMTPSNATMCQILTRLAAYEDTGVEPEDFKKAFNETAILKLATQALSTTPEHLRDLLQAENEGRLVVLPSKTVWELTMDAGPDCDLKCPVDAYDEALGCDLCSKAKPFAYERPCTQERLKGLGKTVFLTREEAEAALKGGEG